MAFRSLSQRFWVKGQNSAHDPLNELPGVLTRTSNMLYTKRGAASTSDGSLIITANAGTVQTNDGPLTDIFLYMPTGQNRFYVGIKKTFSAQLAVPVMNAAVDGGAGGSLAAGTYYYEVTALDGAGGETTVSNQANFTQGGTPHKVNLSWNAITNATGYRLYRGASNAETLLVDNLTTNSYTDDGSAVAIGTFPPLLNTTQQCNYYALPATSYGGGNLIKTLPADYIINQDNTPGGYGGGAGSGQGGGTSNPNSGGAGASAVGGVVGNLSPIPQIIQFTNKLILCLGNGYAPQISDGAVGGSTTALTNTFVSAYPTWVTNIAQAVGNYVKPTVANGHIYKCIQLGTTGGVQPTFPTVAKQTVADGSVIWQEAGSDTAGSAPPGAAHGIVHAGALWLANTSVTNTADGLDGPCALRMSDVNNPLSWNPINAAFLAKDDGTQITGLASFSIAEAGIAPTEVLVVFKEFSTYVVTGVFGATDFAIQQAQTDLGCIAPRSIQFVPGFGIVRLTHLGVAVFDGVRDRIISEELRPYIFADPTSDITAMDWNYAYFSKGAQAAVPPLYMLAIPLKVNLIGGFISLVISAVNSSFPTGNYWFKLAKITAAGETAISPELGPYSLDTSHSAVITIPSASDALRWRVYYTSPGGAAGQENTYQEYTEAAVAAAGRVVTISSYTNAGSPRLGQLSRVLCYDLVLKAWSVMDLPFGVATFKQVRSPGTIPITIVGGWLDGTMRRVQAGDTTWDGTAVSWSMRTAEVFGASANDRTYIRRVLIRGKATTLPAKLTATVTLNGAVGTSLLTREYDLSGGQFQCEMAVGATALNAHIQLSGTGVVSIESVDWSVAPKPTGVPVMAR